MNLHTVVLLVIYVKDSNPLRMSKLHRKHLMGRDGDGLILHPWYSIACADAKHEHRATGGRVRQTDLHPSSDT